MPISFTPSNHTELSAAKTRLENLKESYSWYKSRLSKAKKRLALEQKSIDYNNSKLVSIKEFIDQLKIDITSLDDNAKEDQQQLEEDEEDFIDALAKGTVRLDDALNDFS